MLLHSIVNKNMYLNRLYHFLILLMLPIWLYSQNNIYHINDKVFEYYDKCAKMIRDPKVLPMTDTLFNKAATVNDVKAQCIALYLKADHYYYANDTIRLRESVKKMRPFVIKTPYLQYYFGMLNRIVNIKLSNRLYAEALQEIESYQKEALYFDNSYAIAFSYNHFGNFYLQLRETEIAVENYLKGIDYLNKYGNPNEAYSMYTSLARIFREQKKFVEAIDYYKKSMLLTATSARKIITLLELSELSFAINQPDSARSYFAKADSLHTLYPLKGTNLPIYFNGLVNYYLQEKEYEKALLLTDSLTEASRIARKVQIYRGLEDYKNLSFWLEKKIDYISTRSSEELNAMISKNSIRFENAQLEAEKNKLALQNSAMRIARMEHEKGLLEAEQERNKLLLQASELKLKNIDLVNQQHEIEIDHSRSELIRQRERAASLEELDNLNRTILYIVISSFVILLVIFAAYSFQRRKSIKRLKHERNAALVAKEEAMNAREEAEHAREEAEVAREEAEVARVEAELANRQKTVFFENMSHEIRTPLNAIVGFSEVLNSGEDLGLTKEEREEYLGLIFKNSDLLTTLVNDVLDLSRLESNHYSLSFSQVSLNELCNVAFKNIASRVPDGVTTILQVPTSCDDIFYTDYNRVQQILTNFLTNACKYTEQGSITLGYSFLPNGDVEFYVEDTGSGIPKEKADEVFVRFGKLDDFKQGTGLGLNICLRLAHLLTGNIYLDTNYTPGARFVFVHPRLNPSN